MLHLKHRVPRILRKLTEEQKHMYQSERLINFRWIAKLFATHSSYVLTAADVVPWDLHLEIAALGQFAEVAYCIVDPGFVFANLDRLTEPDFPLEGYSDLKGTELVAALHGTSADLRGYVAYRRSSKQVIVAFSGTRTLSQSMLDCHFSKRKHPGNPRCRVHRGFWRLYRGIADQAFAGVKKALDEHEVDELVLTGHSMGGAISYLLAVDLLSSPDGLKPGLSIKIAVFGSPRPGDARLAEHWQDIIRSYRAQYGQHALIEYAVKAYNDGVPSLPPASVGYRHLCRTPLYLVQDRLYRIPESESEHALFNVAEDKPDGEPHPPQFPRGGHNYYNGRDMEKFSRRMEWVSQMMSGGTDWEELYKRQVIKYERRNRS